MQHHKEDLESGIKQLSYKKTLKSKDDLFMSVAFWSTLGLFVGALFSGGIYDFFKWVFKSIGNALGGCFK